MSNKELSDTFDSLLYIKGITPLDEYEKSVLLTKAQEELILAYYKNTFEGNEESKRNLSPLIKEYIKEISEEDDCFNLEIHTPNDLWFIIYEEAWLGNNICSSDFVVPVIPITNDEYRKVKRNPFRCPNKKKVLRLETGNNNITIISNYKLSGYKCRYISKPTPIILIDFDEVSIDGINKKTECKLPNSLHKSIVELAVNMVINKQPNQAQSANV